MMTQQAPNQVRKVAHQFVAPVVVLLLIAGAMVFALLSPEDDWIAPPSSNPRVVFDPDAIKPDKAEIKRHMTPDQCALGDPIMNSVGMIMVPIPAGQFLMGSPDSESDAGDDEKPQHLVRITKPFYLSVFEVTQRQYEVVMGVRPWDAESSGEIEIPNLPATWLTYDDAVEFCRKLSEREAVEYRLPTEAEWEYACRAGSTTTYCFGTGRSRRRLAWFANYSSDGRYSEYAYPELRGVGHKLPNAWGLYDMHGNVWEWCQDWYAPYENDSVSDPTGPVNGNDHVFRGGAFDSSAVELRSAKRCVELPPGHYHTIGFRPVSILAP